MTTSNLEYNDSKRIVSSNINITTSIQGNNGGTGRHVAGQIAGAGGGGGHSSAGSNGGVNTNGGNGGNGTANSITGSSITYSTGGGGGSAHAAGTGGSSNANNNTGSGSGGATGTVTANTGSGGGGGNNGNLGSAGSAGIVVIRFSTSGNTYSQVGGTVDTSTVSGQTIIKWTATSGTRTFTPTSSFNVQYLVVGGGGSAGCGNEPNGAGGAGGYLAGSSHAVTAKSYTIKVGAGGAPLFGTANRNGENGTNSRFDDFIAIGGGAGGSRGNTAFANVGKDGASGGGGGTKDDGTTSTTISGGLAITKTISERPTNVQKQSIIIEKDTGYRTIFDGDQKGRWYSTSNFDSLIESYTSQKQRYIEWFSGKKVTWTLKTVVTSSASIDIEDDIDGGAIISTGTTTNSSGFIGFNNKLPFSPIGSVMIAVLKHGSTLGGESYTGLQSGAAQGEGQGAWSYVKDNWEGACFNLYTVGASNDTWVQTGCFKSDTNWHTHKIELTPSSGSLQIDGNTTVTSTTNLPANTVELQPSIGIKTDSSTNRTLNIRYMEVYNT